MSRVRRERRGWRAGVISRFGLGLVGAVLAFNVLGWLMVLPAAPAEAGLSSPNPALCGHESPASDLPSAIPHCPLCFPLGHVGGGALPPASPQPIVFANVLRLGPSPAAQLAPSPAQRRVYAPRGPPSPL